MVRVIGYMLHQKCVWDLGNGEGIAKYKWLTWEANLEYVMLVGHFEG